MTNGERECGCAWEYRNEAGWTNQLVMIRRCDEHARMCRSIEPWEAELIEHCRPKTIHEYSAWLDVCRRKGRAP